MADAEILEDEEVTGLATKSPLPPREIKTGLTMASVLQDKGLPEDCICVVCLDKRKEVFIQTCGHLVYCRACDADYNRTHPNAKECPLCRKEYKKTHLVHWV